MVTIKKRIGNTARPRPASNCLLTAWMWRRQQAVGSAVTAAVLVAFCGCTPAGPRALLQGKKLIEEGKYNRAIPKLQTATSILATNAQAWNYLGLAYHHAGQGAEAEKAYQRALVLNHDLSEARYNLGCLWLAQNKETFMVTIHIGRNQTK